MACRGKDSTLHFVMIPYPLQGHINPMVQFAKTLIQKHSDIIVTFVNNHYNNKRILQNQSSSDKRTETNFGEQRSRLRFVSVDNGLPEDFDYTDLKTEEQWKQFHGSSQNMREPFKKLVQSLMNRGESPISCIVFGSFCPWAHSVAQELAIASAFFWTQSATVFSIYFHVPLLAANGFFPYKKHQNDEEGPSKHGNAPKASNSKVIVEAILEDNFIEYIPGVPPLRPSTFPTLVQVDDLHDPTLKILREQFEILGTCDQVIINSFAYLEPHIVGAFKDHTFRLSLVGPLLPLELFDMKFHGIRGDIIESNLMLSNYECLSWLDSKPNASVLYVSFGSVFMPKVEDLQSIANAIMSKKQPFLWVIKPRSSIKSLEDIFPKEFLDNTCDYGLIIEWAPQLQVLSHPSIGAFLTHCGWNSTLESLSLGVPLICFPIVSDQPTNATFVMDIWKAGMTIKRDDKLGKVDSHEVEKVINEIINEEDGKNMRARAKELQEVATLMIQSQSSSNNDLESFVDIVREKTMLK